MTEPNWDESIRRAKCAIEDLHSISTFVTDALMPKNLRDVAWVLEGSVRTLATLIEQERTRAHVSAVSQGRRED